MTGGRLAARAARAFCAGGAALLLLPLPAP